MKKIIIGVVVAIVVIAAGVGGFLLVKKNTSNTDDDNKTLFQPTSTDGQPFIATTVVTPKKGSKATTVMKTDGQGISEYTLKTGGGTKLVFTKDFYYACSGNRCSKIPSDAENGFVSDPKSYDITQAEINNAQKSAQFVGQQSCLDGQICDVWTANAFNDSGSSATIYVDSESRRVLQIVVTDEEGTKAVTTYAYEPVNIKIPSNAREIKIQIPSAPIEE